MTDRQSWVAAGEAFNVSVYGDRYLEYEQLLDQYDSRVGAAHSEVLGFPSRLPGPRGIQESTLDAVVDVIDRGPGHAVAVVQPPGTGKTW
jgi:hypothetical protein